MSRWRRAPAVTVHHTQRDAGRESHYERRREEVHDGSDATVHPAIMAGKLRALVTQLAGEVLAIDYWRISATLDVHQQHRLDVPRGRLCLTKRYFTADISIREIWIFMLAEHACNPQRWSTKSECIPISLRFPRRYILFYSQITVEKEVPIPITFLNVIDSVSYVSLEFYDQLGDKISYGLAHVQQCYVSKQKCVIL